MTTRIVVAAAGVLGIFAFLVIAELGINAGLIHYGVRIGHLDVGGMSPVAADRLIGDAGLEMASPLIEFRGGPLGNFSWTPAELGWTPPERFEMSAKAMRVGRSGGLFRSLADRIRSWTRGVEIRWDAPSGEGIESVAEAVAAEAAAAGLEVDVAKLESLMLKATQEWPRPPFYEIPFES